MTLHRKIYRVARSVLFATILTVVGIYLFIYVLLSVPRVQNYIRDVAEREAAVFLGSKVKIDNLEIKPFNEVVLHGVNVEDRDGNTCLSIETVGAGINLFKWLREGRIEFSYGEIIGLRADIVQKEDGQPLNIAFIIDAFRPKDKNKPPTKFDLALKNVVLRRCCVTFNRAWKEELDIAGQTDFNHLRISDIKADINLPQLKNDDFIIDLRRLAFKVSGGLEVEKIALRTHITNQSVSVANLIIDLPGTELRPSDMSINFSDFSHIAQALEKGNHRIVILDNEVTPADFSCFWSPLRNLNQPLSLSVEVEGNTQAVDINRFSINDDDGLELEFAGLWNNPLHPEVSKFDIENLQLSLKERNSYGWLGLLPEKAVRVKNIIARLTPFTITAEGTGNVQSGGYKGTVDIITSAGNVGIEGEARSIDWKSGSFSGTIVASSLDIGRIADRSELGVVDASLDINGVLKGKEPDGKIEGVINNFYYKGIDIGGINLMAEKVGHEIEGEIEMDNVLGRLSASGNAVLAGAESKFYAQGETERLKPSLLGILPKYSDYCFDAGFYLDLEGNNTDNIMGEVRVEGFNFYANEKPSLTLNNLLIKSAMTDEGRDLQLKSDWLDMQLTGAYHLSSLPGEARNLASRLFPSLVSPALSHPVDTSEADLSILIHPDNTLPEFLNLPFRFLVPIPVDGSFNGATSTVELGIDIPYLQQGKNKLVRDSRLLVEIDGERDTYTLDLSSVFPVKKGELELNMRLWGQPDDINADIGWSSPQSSDFRGSLSLGASLGRNPFSHTPEIDMEIKPSIFDAGTARWNIGRSNMTWHDRQLQVDNFKIWHDRQFIEIAGIASPSAEDSIRVSLAEIDLDYIFSILNINYVSFGGIASGEVNGNGVLSKDPELSTDNLFVKNLAYNGAVLGDGALKSRWVNDEKKVEILADVTSSGIKKAKIDGGIWVTRDSLSFGIDANRIPVDFLAPFMSAFSSEVKGFASGRANLYGTFKDIDLSGDIYADSLMMKLDYTNTYYHGSDSVFLRPGKIEIPSFRLYDRDGHSALLNGTLTHKYFHDPQFTFRLTDARNLLCYDTNRKINPDWYGTVYGSGGAIIRGWPGMVAVSVDMNVVGPSTFTFALNDTQAAQDYHFLTFTDKRKEAIEKQQRDTVADFIAGFRKKMETDEGAPSKFMLDLRASVTPSSLFTLVMDPVAGDKILARGNGALQMEYDTETEQLQMMGKYVLEEGSYNFSLQDLILKDFVIKEGSSISFNGDPLNALLDITAAYRVNTNLSDLDKSFSTDRDLNRTNVPVDALLMVKGEMQQPEITFDIELPTLTQDVERKVKSIISTDDMMSRQIIYLLALNRFYTPEYMGAGSNGGELAAVASSTLSSQLTNMLGQLTDKFTVAPSIRSDKGDFSDVEFDVALSSRLLNNRLLINGNFGYRDRSTSTTTFVGDFDIEYLLNRNGNLRLKAYNHFNDQNYYLREALTTQGLGIVFRKDFDDAFKWLRPRRKKVSPPSSSKDGEEEPKKDDGKQKELNLLEE